MAYRNAASRILACVCAFAFFASFPEGQAVAIGLPFAALVVIFGLLPQRRNLS